MDDKFLINSQMEASYLLKGIEFESIAEFDLFSVKVLSKYINDEKRIKAIISSKAFAFEVMFIKWAKGTVYEDFIDFFFKNLRVALEDHKDEVRTFYAEFDLQIHEALVSYQDAAALANTAHLENRRTIIKSGFSSLGEIVESSLYPQLQLVYRILTCSKESSLYGNKTNLSNGKVVSELINSSDVIDAVLKTLLRGVPLNQWRNISNHSSYKYSKNSDSIFCEYGNNNNSSVTLKYEDFFELFKAIDCIQILLKICLELSSTELEVKKDVTTDDEYYELTIESIMSQIGNVFAVLNYDVLGVDKILNQWKIKITDVRSLGKIKFQELGNELIPYFVCMYKVHGIMMELEIFDTKGRTFQKMSLGDYSKIK
ncbi:hypothetical protein AAEH92_10330 [Shewanella xiamenensis]|uniref:hypothetical protein n=1 Tax=Shewanella xiamenensis TaxID=332186 RepID=UPI00313C4CD2